MKSYNGIVELTVGTVVRRPGDYIGKTIGMGTAADSLRLYRFERTDSENMGEIYPPRQFASTEKRRSGDISRACLSFGREMLSAANPVQHFTQKSLSGTVFTTVIRPGTYVQTGFRSVLSVATIRDARRTDLSGSGTLGKVTVDTGRAGI